MRRGGVVTLIGAGAIGMIVAVVVGAGVTGSSHLSNASTEPGGAAAAAPRGAMSFRVAEIRFGVVEPPVMAQRDITVSFPVSNLNKTARPIECSGLVWIDRALLAVSDRHQHAVFRIPVDTGTMAIGEPAIVKVIASEQQLVQDAENIAVRPRVVNGRFAGWYGYIMSSLSNRPDGHPDSSRQNLARFEIAPDGSVDALRPMVMSAQSIRAAIEKEFKARGVAHYESFAFSQFGGPDRNTDRWGNIEGLCFTPARGTGGSTRMLGGMRNPTVGHDALFFVIDGVDEALEADDAVPVRLVDFFGLNLDGRGVSDLRWDPVTSGYLIAAARSNGPKLSNDRPYPLKNVDSALYWWSGRKSEPPVLFARCPDMTIEAICRIGNTRCIAIGSDERDESEGRENQQSQLVILEFTGLTVK